MKTSEIKGVNLGGWLVLERWITPEVFRGTDVADEYSLCVQLGHEQAAQRLTDHRRSFITEETIAQIANSGLNTVRLPVGYWLFGGVEPYVDGASRYVDQLFIWAEKHNVSVIVDLHAAPGSQNGWDHSGRAGTIGWHQDPNNVDATLRFLANLCEKYGAQASLIGVEVMNEPHWSVPIEVLMDYYRRAYQVVREKCPEQIAVVFSDAFRAGELSSALAGSNMQNIALDMHLYQLFTDADRKLDLKGHLRKVTKVWPKTIRESSRLPVLIGEWSAAMDESHTRYTNEDYKKYFLVQVKTFELHGAGWVYWTTHTQDGGAWSLLDHPEFLTN